MLFEKRFWPGIADGSITLTFRRWKRRQVVPGNRYRTPVGLLKVESLDVIDPAAITDHEAVKAGYDSASALVADLRGDDSLPVYRVLFRYLDEPDPRDELAASADLSAQDVAGLRRRLSRLDASATGAWTAPTLKLIAANPGVRAADLARQVGRETQPFKLDVRKLKNLGLTISLEVGYRISPRGEAFLRSLDSNP